MNSTNTTERPYFDAAPKPLLFILSGPSGVGKDAVLNKIKHSGIPMDFVVTVTTRPRRPREIDNVDYWFVSEDEFKSLLDNDGLLEHANVYGNWYGVPKTPVRESLAKGRNVMLKVDVQGVVNIRKVVPQAVTIFLAPSSHNELERRLKMRRTESDGDLAKRLKVAEDEMKQIGTFDYVVVNGDGKIDRAVDAIRSIITAENCRVMPRHISI